MIKNTPLTNLNFMATENKTKEEVSTDFDLPDVSETGGKAKPRIHQTPGDSVCTSCEA